MLRDPYITAWWRQRRNRARAEGVLGWLRAVLVPLAAGLVLVPLVRPLFLAFLDREPEGWAAGTEQVVLRAGLVIVGWLSLDVYAALIRSRDRDVLAQLPVDTAAVVRAQLLEVAASRWWLVPGAALVLSPLGWQAGWGLWGLALLALAGVFVLGLTASAMVHLLAISITDDERWAALLDLVRGSNPRAQAAFIYAPGVVLLLSGLIVTRAARGVAAVATGSPLGWLDLALPPLAGLLCALPLPRLARASWFRGSAVVAEIDARYATLADPEEALRVYLDWGIRFLPARVHLFALNDLRHGWRMRRTLITGAWLAGLLAFAAGWTSDAAGPSRAALVVVLVTFLVVSNSLLLDRDEPAFLVAWLPPGGLSRAGARAVVLALWSAPIGLLGASAPLLRQGLGAAGQVLLAWVAALAVAVALALACGRLRERGLAVYGPVAAVLAAALAAAVGTA